MKKMPNELHDWLALFILTYGYRSAVDKLVHEGGVDEKTANELVAAVHKELMEGNDDM